MPKNEDPLRAWDKLRRAKIAAGKSGDQATVETFDELAEQSGDAHAFTADNPSLRKAYVRAYNRLNGRDPQNVGADGRVGDGR